MQVLTGPQLRYIITLFLLYNMNYDVIFSDIIPMLGIDKVILGNYYHAELQIKNDMYRDFCFTRNFLHSEKKLYCTSFTPYLRERAVEHKRYRIQNESS